MSKVEGFSPATLIEANSKIIVFVNQVLKKRFGQHILELE